jgi:gluconate 2-dehydrogenase alpha chain
VLNGKRVDGGNPFEGSRSKEYPTPPMMESKSGEMFAKAAKELGYTPFPVPSGNLSEPYVNPDDVARNHCLYCGFCERFGCEVGAKADPTVTVIPLALKTGKFEIRMRANAYQITNDGTTAKSVLYYDQHGAINEQPADIVIVASWVLNNARLLLMSKLGTPYDPVTATGQIGRNYAYQTGGGGATGYFNEKKFRRYMGAGALSTAMDDLNADNFDHSGLGFLGGGSVTAGASGARPIQSLSVPPGTPSFGRNWKVAVKQYYDRVMSIGFQGESPAYQTHYVDLDPNYRDNYGNPLLRITFDWEVNERKMVAYAGTKLQQIMQAINPDILVGGPGSLPAHYDVGPYQSTHNTGGTIMGADPGTSAVNTYMQMWNAENVFVCGASNFPQNAGFNPTGTVGALAYRCAEGIIKYHEKGGGSLV